MDEPVVVTVTGDLATATPPRDWLAAYLARGTYADGRPRTLESALEWGDVLCPLCDPTDTDLAAFGGVGWEQYLVIAEYVSTFEATLAMARYGPVDPGTGRARDAEWSTWRLVCRQRHVLVLPEDVGFEHDGSDTPPPPPDIRAWQRLVDRFGSLRVRWG